MLSVQSALHPHSELGRESSAWSATPTDSATSSRQPTRSACFHRQASLLPRFSSWCRCLRRSFGCSPLWSAVPPVNQSLHGTTWWLSLSTSRRTSLTSMNASLGWLMGTARSNPGLISGHHPFALGPGENSDCQNQHLNPECRCHLSPWPWTFSIDDESFYRFKRV